MSRVRYGGHVLVGRESWGCSVGGLGEFVVMGVGWAEGVTDEIWVGRVS